MSAVPQHPQQDNTPNPVQPPARHASVTVDELGISIRAQLRIRVVKEVSLLFEMTPPEQHAELLEQVIVMGATMAVTTADLSATDAAQMKLVLAAEAMTAAYTQGLERQELHNKANSDRIEAALTAFRTQLDDTSKQEALLRAELKAGQGEIVKAAEKLEVSRGELEKRTSASIEKLNAAQADAREEVIKGTGAALRQLLDKNDPTSAPSLITTIMEKAGTDMRAETAKNVTQLVTDLTKQFGENSPLVEKIAKTVRDGAEAEAKQATEQVAKLREDLLTQRTRQANSPHLIGDGYEENLLELTGHGAAVYGWTVERTGNEIGGIAGSKKGDHLITDENDVKVAAIEARARKNVSARAFYDGLRETAKNRGVKIVMYLARTTDDLPSGLGEFSRGQMPLHYKELADGIHAIAMVIDPSSDTVAERIAMALWWTHQLSERAPELGTHADAQTRIATAQPWVQQILTRLGMFTAIKTGLTKSTGEIDKVRTKVTELESTLNSELHNLEQVLWGNDNPSADATAA
jgi:hypothetical protein